MSEVTNSPRGSFLLAFGLILSIMVIGTVGPASEAFADGGGGDTIIIVDTTIIWCAPGKQPAAIEANEACDDRSIVPSTTQEVIIEWALRLQLLF
jgi:hypothetical protein